MAVLREFGYFTKVILYIFFSCSRVKIPILKCVRSCAMVIEP